MCWTKRVTEWTPREWTRQGGREDLKQDAHSLFTIVNGVMIIAILVTNIQ